MPGDAKALLTGPNHVRIKILAKKISKFLFFSPVGAFSTTASVV